MTQVAKSINLTDILNTGGDSKQYNWGLAGWYLGMDRRKGVLVYASIIKYNGEY